MPHVFEILLFVWEQLQPHWITLVDDQTVEYQDVDVISRLSVESWIKLCLRSRAGLEKDEALHQEKEEVEETQHLLPKGVSVRITRSEYQPEVAGLHLLGALTRAGQKPAAVDDGHVDVSKHR